MGSPTFGSRSKVTAGAGWLEVCAPYSRSLDWARTLTVPPNPSTWDTVVATNVSSSSPQVPWLFRVP
ncbi:hypothetical protein D9M71_481670 [compost metagenome]